MKAVEVILAAILLYIFVMAGPLVAPVTCTTPEPMSVINFYPFIWALVMTATGFIVGVILLYGKELLERRFNEA